MTRLRLTLWLFWVAMTVSSTPYPRPAWACMSALQLEIQIRLGDVPEWDLEAARAFHVHGDAVVGHGGQHAAKIPPRRLADRREGLHPQHPPLRAPEMLGLLERTHQAGAGNLEVIGVLDDVFHLQRGLH